MIIRRAAEGDTRAVLTLLSQVLEIHAAIRPDIFVPGTTKYSEAELLDIFSCEDTPVYVAEDGGKVVGYAFCVIQKKQEKDFLVPIESIYIDDLCVDGSVRGKHIGRALFEYVLEEAKRRGCYNVTLNVWEGNDAAKRFYEKMGMKPMSTHMETIVG